MPPQTELKDKVLAALPLILQHCAQADADAAYLGRKSYNSTRLLCTLLQVSQSCRAAVQQSGAQCRVQIMSWSQHRLNSFSSWLPKHAGHLQSLALEQKDHHEFAEQLVSLGLQLYGSRRMQQPLPVPQQHAARRATRAAAAAGRECPADDTAGRCAGMVAAPLRLQALQWDRMETPAVLQAVSTVTSLTKLCLRRLSTEHATPAMLAALGNLVSLRSLEVQCAKYIQNDNVAEQFTEMLAQLSCLSHLVVQSISYVPGVLARLPVSLQELELWVDRSNPQASDAVSLQLGHLSALVGLKLQWCPRATVTAHVQLPVQLTWFACCGKIEAALPHSLVAVELFNPGNHPRVVQQLGALPSLSSLAVQIDGDGSSNVWRERFQPLLSVLHNLTGLSRLGVLNEWIPNDVMVDLQWGRALGQLSRLQVLMLEEVHFAPDDALHLAALTGLSKMVLNTADGVNDMVLCALALKLTNLTCLSVPWCDLSTQVPLPVLATLIKLEKLELHGNSSLVVDDTGLLLLSSLTGLTCLTIPEDSTVSEEGQQQLCNCLPLLGGLTRV